MRRVAGLRGEVERVGEFLPALADEADDECCPAGLVRGTESFAGLGVEILVKQEEILPVGDVAVAVSLAKTRAVAFFVWQE